MVVHSGERARMTGTFHCQSCHAKVHVDRGDRIPACPNGHQAFDERTDEPLEERAEERRRGRGEG